MFNIASAPFAHNRRQTQTLMLLVMLACLPGFLAQSWFFGWGTLIQILLALVTALASEAWCCACANAPSSQPCWMAARRSPPC